MSSQYDRAITVFSPDGHLFQVDYAQEAANRGSSAMPSHVPLPEFLNAFWSRQCMHLNIHHSRMNKRYQKTMNWVAVKGEDVIVLAVEKKAAAKLQDDRSIRKIFRLEDHISVAFAGLTADARVLLNRAKVECQSYRLTLEDPVTVKYITSYIGKLKQMYTQSNGRRPFGVSCLIVGFDPHDGKPHLFQTDPSGTYYEWKANSIGKNAKTVREYLEKHYKDGELKTRSSVIKLALKSLLEVVQAGSESMEVAVIEREEQFRMLTTEELKDYLKEIETERKKDTETTS